MIQQSNARQIVPVFLLCLALWLGGGVFLIIGLFLLPRSAFLYGGLSITVAALIAGAGAGLFFLRRWGVVLFGLLALLGSVNHLTTTLARCNDLSQPSLPQIFSALVSILFALLIPAALIYLTLLMWRQVN